MEKTEREIIDSACHFVKFEQGNIHSGCQSQQAQMRPDTSAGINVQCSVSKMLKSSLTTNCCCKRITFSVSYYCHAPN